MVSLDKNPFEAPKAGDGFRSAGTPGILDPVEAIKQGWEGTKRNLGPWLAMVFLGGIIMYASILLTLGLGMFLLLPVLGWGLVKFLLNTVDGDALFGDLFAGFSRYGEALGGMLACFLLLFLAILPGYAISIGSVFLSADGGGSAVLGALGSVVSIAWFVMVLSRLAFAPFYIVDQGFGAVDAFKASWDATRNNRLSTVLFFLLTMAVQFVGMLALLIGIIPATMVIYSGMASAYRQISGTAR